MALISMLGSTLGLGLVSGINLYITILTVGLGIKFHFIHLTPALGQLTILASPIVLGVAGVMFVLEFFADKIPWVDSIWDALHSIVRPVGAVVIGMSAMGNVDPTLKIVMMLLCGGMALSSFATKAGTRIAANFSPEPFSNIGLSLLGDTLATSGAYLSIAHPAIMLGISVVFFILFLSFAPSLYRLVKMEGAAVFGLVKSWFAVKRATASGRPNVETPPEMFTAGESNQQLMTDAILVTKCAAGAGMRGLKNSIGYLFLSGQSLTFLARRMMRYHVRSITAASITEATYRRGLLFDTLTVMAESKRYAFRFFIDGRENAETLAQSLGSSSMKTTSSALVTENVG